MSNKKENHEDLNAFEEALAALRPRSGRLGPEWRSLLAKEAALAASLQGNLDGNALNGDSANAAGCREVIRSDVSREAATTGQDVLPPLQNDHLPDCSCPGGHVWICGHCGVMATTAMVATNTSLGRRWGWAAAISAVTAVAATLLAVLLIPASPPVADRREAATTAADLTPAAKGVSEKDAAESAVAPTKHGRERSGRFLYGNAASLTSTRTKDLSQTILTIGDANSFDDLLARSVPANRQLATAGSSSPSSLQTAEASLTNHDLLLRLLNNPETADESWRRPMPPSSNSTENQL